MPVYLLMNCSYNQLLPLSLHNKGLQVFTSILKSGVGFLSMIYGTHGRILVECKCLDWGGVPVQVCSIHTKIGVILVQCLDLKGRSGSESAAGLKSCFGSYWCEVGKMSCSNESYGTCVWRLHMFHKCILDSNQSFNWPDIYVILYNLNLLLHLWFPLMPWASTTCEQLKTISCPCCGKNFCTKTNVLQHINQLNGPWYGGLPLFCDLYDNLISNISADMIASPSHLIQQEESEPVLLDSPILYQNVEMKDIAYPGPSPPSTS